MTTDSLTFAAVGAAHPHAFNQIGILLGAGARCAGFYDDDPAVTAAVIARYPGIDAAPRLDRLLDDPQIDLIVNTVRHDRRAALGIEAMRRGKDTLCAKPGFTTPAQLDEARRVQAETGRRYWVYFSERLASRATLKALELVRAGRIGRVVQTLGFGPHRLFGGNQRPDWWFDSAQHGGILNDLASHQIDQFLVFTGSQRAEIASAQIGTARFREYPGFEDFGDLVLRSDSATGYIRVDWLTPDGLPTWGDVRLMLIGTEGSIEARKNIDLDGRAGTDHLLVVDRHGVERVLCAEVDLPFARQLIADVRDRTDTALSQAHCFTVCDLALRAQASAVRLPFAG
ncbi:MAG: Gfo/Idh/MocA family oxidoreductase [Anaerolineae bacterium]|nr:Gfo/Idh/MocA family oxidoreductase [Anaerolineae bacterium]NUQ05729.1 Gfo/Idh/MocA family oxidoreductase [Anaerolineae bacterium]